MKSSLLISVPIALLFVSLSLFVGNFFSLEQTEHTWQIDHHGALKQFQPLSGTTGIGISETSELITIDFTKDSVLSKIDLKSTGSDAFALLDFVLVTYSSASSTFYVYEKYSGIFLEEVKLESPPVHFGQFYGYGVLVLDSRGLLIAWNNEFKKVIGKYDVKSFKTAIVDDLVHVSLGSSILCLNNQAENIVANLRSNSEIIDLRHGLAISKDQIINLKASSTSESITSKKLTTSLSNPKILSQDIVAEFEEQRFTLYRVDESNNLEQLTQHAARHASTIIPVEDVGKVLVVAQVPNGFEIHDFTKFLTTYDLGDIVKYERITAIDFEDFSVFVSPKSDHISIVSVSNEEVTVLLSLASTEDLESHSYQLEKSFTISHSILINSPRSISLIEKAQYLAEESHRDSPALRMLVKVKHHLAQLGKAFVDILSGNSQVSTIDEDIYGFQKLLITFDDHRRVLTGRNSQSSRIVWQTTVKMIDNLVGFESVNDEIFLLTPSQLVTVSARTGAVENVRELPSEGEKLIKLAVKLPEDLEEEGYEPFTYGVKSGSSIKSVDTSKHISDNQFYVEQLGEKIKAYKIIGEKLIPTWSYAPQDGQVLTFVKNGDELSPASGIATANRAVLYKYLNPNLVTVITQKRNSQVAVHLLDGITGSPLYVHRHENLDIDANTLKLVQNDNWVVYSFVTKDEHEQQVSVLDLFSTVENASGGEKSAFTGFDTQIHNVLSKTFVFPEKIDVLSSTRTRFGITVKSIVALTETGSLVEIPKFMLNSRRVDDRALTQADAIEFKMMPYEPVIGKPDLLVLNGKQSFRTAGGAGSVLIKPTELELTSVVCYVDAVTEFCTVVQPSLSYDILKSGFDKKTLLATIAVLYAAYTITKPMVSSKKLKAKWLD